MNRFLSAIPLRGSTPSRAYRGLYHGVQIQFGNKISFSDKKSTKKFLPNVHKKTFVSELLDSKFTFNVTTKALRTIKKKGGLDNYLMTTKDELLLNPEAIAMKRALRKLAKQKAAAQAE